MNLYACLLWGVIKTKQNIIIIIIIIWTINSCAF
jgi:hypothetical protein